MFRYSGTFNVSLQRNIKCNTGRPPPRRRPGPAATTAATPGVTRQDVGRSPTAASIGGPHRDTGRPPPRRRAGPAATPVVQHVPRINLNHFNLKP